MDSDHQEYSLMPQKPASSDSNWVDRTMQIAQTCNRLFTANAACQICSVYADKQVEYEIRNDTNLWNTIANPQKNLEVELYRQFLFDEESVVDSVSGRTGDDDEPDERTLVTQRSNQ